MVQEESLEVEVVELGSQMERMREERREEIRLRQLLEEQVGAAGARYRGRLC